MALAIKATGLPPGSHGLHVHEKGLCDGPGFASAGGHWNPTGRQHGRDNPAGAHMGDLPNLEIDASGRGSAAIPLGVAGQGLTDPDGAALVVHAKGDDYRTDPSGNSGTRIACAVIAPPK
jgi:Cu-Zn family superoxide dismutase